MLLLRAPRGDGFPGNCGFLLGLLCASAIGLVALVIVLLAVVPVVVEVAGATATQNVPGVARLIGLVAVGTAQGIAAGGAYWVVALAALQVILRLGVAPHAVVVEGL